MNRRIVPGEAERSTSTTPGVVLAIGPHPDDVELGCFGALAACAAHGYEIHILIMTDGGRGGPPEQRRDECLQSAALLGAQVHFAGLRDCFVEDGVETIDVIEALLDRLIPRIVFYASGKDTHQDHRNTALAVASATRRSPETVLVYQTPTTTLDFMPTYHMDVTDYFATKEAAVRIHTSQSTKYYTASIATEALARYRGFQIGAADRYFEAFEVARLVHVWRPPALDSTTALGAGRHE